MSTTPSARVHILLATEARTAVVIRRGPSKQVCTLLWDRRDNTIRLGQWLKGRIYEQQCDISPDGKHFIYFAMNRQWRSETGGSWTAISRTPYLKAIGLWGKGDCWPGGGLFLDNDTYWINNGALNSNAHHELRAPRNLRGASEWQPSRIELAPYIGQYGNRLVRDGWVARESTRTKPRWGYVLEKPIAPRWLLRKKIGWRGEKHELVGTADGTVIDCPNWSWADRDQSRVVWVEAGKLFSGRLNRTELFNVTEIYDFNPLKFEAIAAPY